VASDDGVTYHGYLISEQQSEEEDDPDRGRIAVEVPRRLGSPKVLRELERPRDEDGDVEHGFTWGYRGGTGPQVSGAAVLSDALGLTVTAFGEGPEGLARDFCEDVMAFLPPQDQEWRMRRRTVLWWVRGWYIGRRMPSPAAVLELPPTTGGLRKPQ